MIKKILLIFALFIFGNSYSQNKISHPIGIGLLQTNTTYPIALYKNEFDKVPIYTIKFKIDKNGSTKFITKIKLKPYLISEGDTYEGGWENKMRGLIRFPPLLKFRVIDSTKTSFKIVTNEDDVTFYFIKINSKSAYYRSEKQYSDNHCIGCPNSVYNPDWNIFETWERYIKRVEYITKNNIEIYDKPNGKLIYENKNNNFIPFNVSEINGDWIKLKKNIGRESNFDESKYYNGWTKWKDENKLLIEIIEQTYK